MPMTIPLESNPNIAAQVGYIAGHSSLMSGLLIGIFGAMQSGPQLESFSKAPANQKRKKLKGVAKSVLSSDLCIQLTEFLDDIAAPLEVRRGNLMHDLWSSGEGNALRLIPSPHGARKRVPAQQVSEETLQSLLVEYKNANWRALGLLRAVNAEVSGASSVAL